MAGLNERRFILERHVHELVNFVSIILYLNFSYLAIRGFKQSHSQNNDSPDASQAIDTND